MPDETAVARRLWRLLEPIHAVVYFSPEPIDELRAVGYRGFWMGYFAGRAAPLGAASPELVHALFYNFSFERVARALPAAWELAPPDTALEARLRGVDAALERQLGGLLHTPEVKVASDLASRVVEAAPLEGRPLFAANLALPVPDDPATRLWHVATLLREHRGDGHIAALVTAGISGREAHVLHSLAAGTPREVYVAARDFGEEEWADTLLALRSKGYVDETGGLTSDGRACKSAIEARTDELAATAYETLADVEVEAMVRALTPLAEAVLRAGDVPIHSPMGIDFSDLVDRA